MPKPGLYQGRLSPTGYANPEGFTPCRDSSTMDGSGVLCQPDNTPGSHFMWDDEIVHTYRKSRSKCTNDVCGFTQDGLGHIKPCLIGEPLLGNPEGCFVPVTAGSLTSPVETE